MQRRKRQTEKEYKVQNPLCKVSLKIIKLIYPVRSPNNSSIGEKKMVEKELEFKRGQERD